MTSRIRVLQSLLDKHNVDALWLTYLPDIRWACGFTGSNGVLIVRRDAAYFVSDGRYSTQAQEEVSDAEVHAKSYDLPGQAKEKRMLRGCRKIGYQADHLTVAARNVLKGTFPRKRWKALHELLVKEVAAKTPGEIALMRRAQDVTERVFDRVLGLLGPGITEKEVAAELTYHHLRLGAESMSFDPVVASGPNAALPHARPTDRMLQKGDAVLVDMGCFVEGYASDMTRTVFLGEPGEAQRRVYELVLAAQMRAIEEARAGMPANSLDEIARDVIRKGGYGDYYNHGLGHGLGLQVHEWPRVSYTVDYDLPADCVVTIEPGIYLPGRFGVRIEDAVVLRDHGCEVLTKSSKDMIVV